MSDPIGKGPLRFPTNAKSIAFCFFEGATLSIPIGGAISKYDLRPFAPPTWMANPYAAVVGFSYLSLIVWSLISLRDQRVLAVTGLLTCVGVFLVMLILFPAAP